MPIRDVLIGNARCNIKHDDTALPINIITVAKTTKLLLSGSIPHIKLNISRVLPRVSLYIR